MCVCACVHVCVCLYTIHTKMDEEQARFMAQRICLHEACKSRDIHSVQRLLLSGADKNAQDHRGWAPIHLCAYNGDGDTLCVLLERRASARQRDNEGKGPVHYAAANGHTHCISILLKYGADIGER